MNSLSAQIEIIEICKKIGGIASSNSIYTAGITHRINKTGKSIGELTIDELLQIHSKYNQEFNELYK